MAMRNIQPYGFALYYTTAYPEQAKNLVLARIEELAQTYNLNPSRGRVPHIEVGVLQELGITVPPYWQETDMVQPMIPGISFFIIPYFFPTHAVEIGWNEKNIRTALPLGPLSDSPCQNFWTGSLDTIYGYVTDVGKESVQQFLLPDTDPIARTDIPLSFSFHLHSRRAGLADEADSNYGPVANTRATAASLAAAPTVVDLSRGVVQYPGDPNVKARDFDHNPYDAVVSWMIPYGWYNEFAMQVGVKAFTQRDIDEYMQWQQNYEQDLLAHLNR